MRRAARGPLRLSAEPQAARSSAKSLAVWVEVALLLPAVVLFFVGQVARGAAIGVAGDVGLATARRIFRARCERAQHTGCVPPALARTRSLRRKSLVALRPHPRCPRKCAKRRRFRNWRQTPRRCSGHRSAPGRARNLNTLSEGPVTTPIVACSLRATSTPAFRFPSSRVEPTTAAVQYIRSYTAADENDAPRNGAVAHSYALAPR